MTPGYRYLGNGTWVTQRRASKCSQRRYSHEGNREDLRIARGPLRRQSHGRWHRLQVLRWLHDEYGIRIVTQRLLLDPASRDGRELLRDGVDSLSIHISSHIFTLHCFIQFRLYTFWLKFVFTVWVRHLRFFSYWPHHEQRRKARMAL